MRRQDINDLLAFLAVARERSFTGPRQSSVCRNPRSATRSAGWRSGSGFGLLTRTTRKVSATEAGERLLRTVAPRFEEIDAELAALSELRDKPAGTIRITAGEHAAESRSSGLHWQSCFPATRTSRSRSSSTMGSPTSLPSVTTPVCGSANRWQGHDRRAHRAGPCAWRSLARLSYFARRPKPKKPQDLTAHDCINLRLPTYGGLYAWEFEKRGRELKVRVEGQLVFNNIALRLKCGAGRAWACVPARGSGADARRRRAAGAGAGRLVSSLFRLSPVLSEPPATHAGLRLAGRCAPISKLS